MEKYFRIAKDITPWKRQNPIESFLSRKADHSRFWRKLYVKYYSIVDREYYKKGCELIEKEILRQKQNFDNFSQLSLSDITDDMIYSLHRYGVSFEEYFIYRFYDLNTHGRRKYNNLKLQYGYCEQFNSPQVRTICEDKSKTYELLSSYFKRDTVLIDTKDKTSEVNDFVKKHIQLILKPLRGHSGQGIKILDSTEISDKFVRENYEEFGPFILEELIQQGNEMAILHPQSINTVRLATVLIDGHAEIYGGAVRIGVRGSNVDNAGAGGIYAGIDTGLGIIVTKARDNKSNLFTVHPDTDIVIPGFRLPEWDKALSLIDEMANLIPGANLIAWDLAYSQKGWCLVEANDIGEQYLLQAPEQTGIKSTLIDLLGKINVRN